MPTWHQTQTMFKYLTPSWHPMSVDYHNSIIIEGPDTADAVSSTKSYFFPLAFGEEKPLSHVPTLNVHVYLKIHGYYANVIYVRSLVVRE